MILTTHYLEEAQALCSRIAIMKKGEVAALDRTEALLSRFEGRVNAAGAEIENLTVGQPDLEDVFLAVTGGEA